MFDSTFFKFLIAFILIVGASFLIMGIAGGIDSKKASSDNIAQPVSL
jgi:hypothetical protein